MNKAMFSSIDIFPTLCGLAGLPVPETVDGTDFSPILTGKDQELSPFLFTCFDHGSPATGDRSWRAVNTEQYAFVLAKTARYGGEDDIREDGMVLYDKLADPYQMSPVYRGMGYDAVIDSLYNILVDHLKQNGDRFIEEQWKTDNGPYYFYNDALMNTTLSGSWRMNGLSFNVKGSSSLPVEMQYNISARSGGLIIYPNPSGQSIKISGARPQDTIMIADLKGKVLIEIQEDVVDVSKLLAGVYIVVAGTASGFFIKY